MWQTKPKHMNIMYVHILNLIFFIISAQNRVIITCYFVFLWAIFFIAAAFFSV